jgi:hypothetical protein
MTATFVWLQTLGVRTLLPTVPLECVACANMQADRATAAVDLEARYQIPPNLLFELLADPRQHDKIFDAILVRRSELW